MTKDTTSIVVTVYFVSRTQYTTTTLLCQLGQE